MSDNRIKDLHLLPKFRDSLSFLYVEHVKIDKHEGAIALHDATGMTPVPAASLAVLMLGPGSNITHSAIMVLAENNCLVVWCGEENVRFYACGMGGTRSAQRLIHQAKMASSEDTRLEVVKRMYCMRFLEDIPPDVTVNQLRGMEGSRVRTAYAKASAESGVSWSGRNYDRTNWGSGDPINRALSAANSCLYGLCHAAILSAGYSPAIGFIHVGKQLSFVYDIADLYKVDITVPLAFKISLNPPQDIERAVRLACRDIFRETKLVSKIIPDIRLALGETGGEDEPSPFDMDEAKPADLWTPANEIAENAAADGG
ncbi:MAG: type I-E CRISPR-associated endonuclease Cas1e [Armatimonadetes bacterium]|nr:type I-E CRISPR-associated endonuclease Cas1e [Armatimonadota bacterium]